jgi:hypothetical protein
MQLHQSVMKPESWNELREETLNADYRKSSGGQYSVACLTPPQRGNGSGFLAHPHDFVTQVNQAGPLMRSIEQQLYVNQRAFISMRILLQTEAVLEYEKPFPVNLHAK